LCQECARIVQSFPFPALPKRQQATLQYGQSVVSFANSSAC
jgi:hypothetical protein